MSGHRARRGNMIMSYGMLTGMIAMAAIVVDLGYASMLQTRALNVSDMIGTAAAGHLDGTDDGIFVARDAAILLAASHAMQGEPITLNPNYTNDPGGDIVFGTWDVDYKEFEPSLEPLVVDAVQIRLGSRFKTLF
ncbi:MAG: hypothetical protein ACI9MC_002493 [Kiritimatiellia bacterium]|jgi:hypothetical protein